MSEEPKSTPVSTENVPEPASPVIAAEVTPEVEASPEGPPKPPRPLSPLSKSTQTLKEAFPNIEEKYIKALLIASRGKVDPAFNGLLFLSDPSYKPEILPPQPLPRSNYLDPQIDEDERLARRLAKQYAQETRQERPEREQYSDLYGNQRTDRHHTNNQEESSFLEHDLPQLKEQFQKGVQETSTKINNWMTSLRKKFEDDDDTQLYHEQSNQGSQQHQRPKSSQPPKLFDAFGEESNDTSVTHGSYRTNVNKPRRSNNFDHDPEELNSDFSQIKLVDDDPPSQPKRPTKPTALSSPEVAPAPKPITKIGSGSKWEPLNAVEPTSIDNHDPFLVADSDEEEETEAKKNTKLTTKTS